MRYYDLSIESDAAYRLAEAVEGGQYTNIFVIEFHEKVDSEGIYNCIEGHEYFVSQNKNNYRTFLQWHLADQFPANISIAVKLGEVWFVSYDCGSNYYSGFGPSGIRTLREACVKQKVKIIFEYNSFKDWFKKEFEEDFVEPMYRKDLEEQKKESEFLGVWEWFANYSVNVQRSKERYQDKDEEEIRDILLTALNTDHNHRAFGEAVQGKGRTDIIMRSKNGKDELIVELKKWNGIKSFIDAVEQLLGYLTWDNSIAGLVFFCSNKDFSKILEHIEKHISDKHELMKLPPEKVREFHFRALYPNDNYKRVDIHAVFVCLT